jgi:predicted acylesterase/phospholipase RssA
MEDSLSWDPTVLILGPGGIRGFLELGALLLFEKERYLERINKYVGVSVGAIISLLLVAGCSVTEIISDAVDVNIFQDISCINPTESKQKMGIISNRHIQERLIKRMESKFGIIPTMEQLYLITGKILTCVSLNIDTEKVEYINKDTYPTICCVDAVLMSMNIPFLFYKIKHNGHVYIDGALGDPYPIHLYDDGETDILGIYINSKTPTHLKSADDSLPLYFYKVAFAAMTQLKNMRIANASSRCKHLRLSTTVLDTIGITSDLETKSQMIMIGFEKAQRFVRRLRNNIIVYNGSEEQSIDYDGTNALSSADIARPDQSTGPDLSIIES